MKTLLLVLFVPLFLTLTARGNVLLSFAGGNGAPLSITIAQPVDFTITTAVAAGNGPVFLFDAAGDNFTTTGLVVTGSITYQINSGAALALNRLGSGTAANDATADDSYLFPSTRPALAVGNVLRISAGTLTTSTNFAGAPPTGGSFSTFVATSAGTRVSTFGTSVPEPGSVALLGAGVALAVGYRATRRRAGR